MSSADSVQTIVSKTLELIESVTTGKDNLRETNESVQSLKQHIEDEKFYDAVSTPDQSPDLSAYYQTVKTILRGGIAPSNNISEEDSKATDD